MAVGTREHISQDSAVEGHAVEATAREGAAAGQPGQGGQLRVHTWHGTCRRGWPQQGPMGAGPCSDWEKAGVGEARETTPAFIIRGSHGGRAHHSAVAAGVPGLALRQPGLGFQGVDVQEPVLLQAIPPETALAPSNPLPAAAPAAAPTCVLRSWSLSLPAAETQETGARQHRRGRFHHLLLAPAHVPVAATISGARPRAPRAKRCHLDLAHPTSLKTRAWPPATSPPGSCPPRVARKMGMGRCCRPPEETTIALGLTTLL
jgi:hypothetical protein